MWVLYFYANLEFFCTTYALSSIANTTLETEIAWVRTTQNQNLEELFDAPFASQQTSAFHPLQKFKLRHHPIPRCGKPENCRIVMVRCCSVKRLAEIIDYCIYGIRTILSGSNLLFLPAISGCFSLFLPAVPGCYFTCFSRVEARISAANAASLAVFSLHLTAITASGIRARLRRERCFFAAFNSDNSQQRRRD